MLNNFYTLSINDERYNYQCKVFQHYGLPIPTKYVGFKDDTKKELCCLFGHMSLIMMARYMDFPYIFIFEEDAYPCKDIVNKMNYYIDHKPKDCGILIFGRNGESGHLEYHGKYYIDKQRPYGAHAYLVYKNSYTDLLNSMEKIKIADIALRGNNFKEFKPYWTYENLFIQNNIDDKCMSWRIVKSHGKYFYPDSQGMLYASNQLPSDDWENID